MFKITQKKDDASILLDYLRNTGITIHPDVWDRRLKWYRETQTQTRQEASYNQRYDVYPYLGTAGKIKSDWTRLTTTNRFTASKPATQQIPKLMRQAVGDAHTRWMSVDWVAAHPWILACISGDDELSAAIRDGTIYEIAGLSRDIGKVEVLKIINGGLSPHRAEWWGRYPTARDFSAAVADSSRKSGRVTAGGITIETKGAQQHAALGRWLQAMESNAVAKAGAKLTSHGLVLVMHDEVVLEFDPQSQNEEETRLFAEYCMQEGMRAIGCDGVGIRSKVGYSWGFLPDPMPTEGVPSYNWSVRASDVISAITEGKTASNADIRICHLADPDGLELAAASVTRDEKARIKRICKDLTKARKAAEKAEEPGPDTMHLDVFNTTVLMKLFIGELEKCGPVVSDPLLDDRCVYTHAGAGWEKVTRTEMAGAILSVQKKYTHGKGALNLKTRDIEEAKNFAIPEVASPGFFKNSVKTIAFTDCVLLESGEVVPHSADMGLLAEDVRPFEFTKKNEATRFLKFLDEIWEGDEDRTEKQELLQEWLGSCIFGEVTKEAGFCLVLYGPSAQNGKSVLVSLISALFPKRQAQISGLHLLSGPKSEYYAAALSDARLCIQPDSGQQALKETSLFKQLMTGDEIAARHPGGQPFRFRAQAGWIVCANELPTFSESGGAISRRLAVMQFNRSFSGENEDKELLNKLLDERAAVIEWARIGYQRAKAKGGVRAPLSTSYDALLMAESSGLTSLFCEEKELYPVDSRATTEKDFVKLSDLYRCFCDWAFTNRIPREELPSKQGFRSELVALGHFYGRIPRALSPNRDMGISVLQNSRLNYGLLLIEK